MIKFNFKTSLLAVVMMLAVTAFSSNSFAQSHDNDDNNNYSKSSYYTARTAEEIAASKTKQLDKKLSLSSSQYKTIYNYILSAEQQIQALRASDYDKQTLNDQIYKINASTKESIRGVLTSDQLVKYDKWKDNDNNKYGQKKSKKHKKHDKKHDKKNHEDRDDD
ncbi:hypothetical protein BH10BAC5_BH10BAC5_24540 [soil metagenome]